jgi:hypothetical protein
MAPAGQLIGVDSSVMPLCHVIEQSKVLSSECPWTSDSGEASGGSRLPDIPQHTHIGSMLPSPALTNLAHENVGVRFCCDCPRAFPTQAGHNFADSGLALLNRFPDL